MVGGEDEIWRVNTFLGNLGFVLIVLGLVEILVIMVYGEDTSYAFI